jgi:hypothetical protein
MSAPRIMPVLFIAIAPHAAGQLDEGAAFDQDTPSRGEGEREMSSLGSSSE